MAYARVRSLFRSQPEIFWGLVASMYIGNLVLIILNLPLVGLFVKLLRIPFRILFPIIILVCLVGTYSIKGSTFELGVLLFFGLFGYVLKKLKYDVPPLILALIVGRTMEMSFRQSLMRSGGSFSIFWESPVAMILILISLFMLCWNIYRAMRPAKGHVGEGIGGRQPDSTERGGGDTIPLRKSAFRRTGIEGLIIQKKKRRSFMKKILSVIGIDHDSHTLAITHVSVSAEYPTKPITLISPRRRGGCTT